MLQSRVEMERAGQSIDFSERLGCGCILIDTNGRVLRLNEYASRYLGKGLSIIQQRVYTTHSGSNAILQRLITAMLAADPCFEVAPGSVAIPRDEGCPLILRVAPVVGPAHADGAKAVITLVDLEEGPELPDELLRAAFGLTPAEVRLAQRIACGDGLEDIAERHQVSLCTVRAQLKTVFQKTQTHRQSQLVSLLARLGQLR